jgi:uncharacterized protein (DUF697 family)
MAASNSHGYDARLFFMTTPAEQRALFALLLHAALADGIKSDAERVALKRITEGFATDAFNPWVVYQEVLGGRYPIAAVAAELTRHEVRVLAYEMALGVCDTDGPPNAAENAFLGGLRDTLGLSTTARTSEKAAEELAAALPAAVVTSAAATGSAHAVPGVAQIDVPALEKSILNHSILTAALEMLPQSFATMAIVPVQMRMVYNIGKAHGYPLDRGHIRDFLATAGAGLASQAVEGYARKLIGGLAGSLLGKGIIGGLGRAATGAGTGAAVTFAATYAIGQLALRYYAGGRKMEAAVLRDTYRTLLEDGRSLFGRHERDVENRAVNLSPSDVINLVRQG